MDRYRRPDRAGSLVDPGERDAEDRELQDHSPAPRTGEVEEAPDGGRDDRREQERHRAPQAPEHEAAEEDLLGDRCGDDDQERRRDVAYRALPEPEVTGDVVLVRMEQ